MCSSLRTHAMVISILCLLFTLIGIICETSFGSWILNIGTGWSSTIAWYTHDIRNSLGISRVARGIQISIYVYWIVSEVLCWVGTINNNKSLLIPFIICMCLTMLGCFGSAMQYFVPIILPNNIDFNWTLFLVIVSWLILLGLSIYFLVIIIKFYKELASGHVGGFQQGVVLQPYHSPLMPLEGSQAVYAASAHASQHQPPHQLQTLAYSHQPNYSYQPV